MESPNLHVWLLPKNAKCHLSHLDPEGLGGIEHLVLISVIHLDYLSHAEKRKTQSSLCPDSDT